MSDNKETSVRSLLGDFDLFPEELFSHLTPEERGNLKDLLLGSRVQEKEIDLLEDE